MAIDRPVFRQIYIYRSPCYSQSAFWYHRLPFT